MPVLDEYRPPAQLAIPSGRRPQFMSQTPLGLLSGFLNNQNARLSLSKPKYVGGLLDSVLYGDVHAGMGKAGRFIGAGIQHPTSNPFGLGGSLGLGAAADYNVDTGDLVPSAIARYATELGGGNLSFEANANPEGLGAFINWATSF